MYKVDTLLAALRVFRQGIVDEFEAYDRRQRELDGASSWARSARAITTLT